MKTLGKIPISPDKVMKNEELINLQGGMGYDWCCWCGGHTVMGGASTYDQCQDLCSEAFEALGYWYC